MTQEKDVMGCTNAEVREIVAKVVAEVQADAEANQTKYPRRGELLREMHRRLPLSFNLTGDGVLKLSLTTDHGHTSLGLGVLNLKARRVHRDKESRYEESFYMQIASYGLELRSEGEDTTIQERFDSLLASLVKQKEAKDNLVKVAEDLKAEITKRLEDEGYTYSEISYICERL